MPESILARLSHSLSPQPVLNKVEGSSLFSPIQSQVDGLVAGFVEQATDVKSLAALTAGGLAYRVGRIGILGFANGHLGRALSVGAGLAAEVSAFEATHRSLHSVHPDNPNLWRWSGPLCLKTCLLASLVTFGTLKGLGNLTQGQNLMIQHGAQDLAMVLGHQLVHRAGIGTNTEGNMAEQL